MIFEKTLTIPGDEAQKIKRLIHTDTRYSRFDDGDESAYTVHFDDRTYAVVKLCGVYSTEEDPAYPCTEGTLYINGEAVAFTEEDDSFFGDWVFEYGDDVYVVIAEEAAAA